LNEKLYLKYAAEFVCQTCLEAQEREHEIAAIILKKVNLFET